MELWRALLSDPLAIACAVMLLGFLIWAILAWGREPRWMFLVALVLAAASLTAGIGFASLKVKRIARKPSPTLPSSHPVIEVAGTAASSLDVPNSTADPAPVLSSNRRIWVLKGPAQLVEYDWLTSSARRSIDLPRDLVQLLPMGAAGKLKISFNGRMLLGPVSRSFGSLTQCEVWVWNGLKDSRLNCPSSPSTSQAASDNDHVAPADNLDVTLSADGQHLFWYSNRGRNSAQAKDEITNTFRVWQTDLAGDQFQAVASYTFPACKCETGACEETCAQGSVWAPDAGISNFFLVNHFVSGQLQGESVATFLYRDVDGHWTNQKLPAAIDSLADVSLDGTVLIEVVSDSACCGWVNESNDQTLLLSGGQSTVLFDERARFDNADYDVNFSTPDARLSPDLNLVAMTIAATAHPDDEIRLADSGKANPAELERIRHALADLPAVEIVSAGAPGKRIAFLPHAKVVGWLSENELLIIEDHLLTAYDITTQTHTKSRIAVTDDAHIFLR